MPKPFRLPSPEQQTLLKQVQVRLADASELPRCQELLSAHHYLGAIEAVGERMFYVGVDRQDRWLAILVFCSAAKHLRHRDRWIGWSEEQRRRRLALIANNARFLILPEVQAPNLASRLMRLTLDRISKDWQARYGHGLLVAESFVDPQRFRGTAYRAGGWLELGPTAGFSRCARDYYVEHDQPKALFVRELEKGACAQLRAESLPAAHAVVEEKVGPRPTQSVWELRSLVDHFRGVSDHRSHYQSYPLRALLTIIACAHFCGAPRGPTDLAAFAQRLTRAQRRALGIRRGKDGDYPTPSHPTFSRALHKLNPLEVEQALVAFQSQQRGPPPKEEFVAIDGKQPSHSGGQHLLTAMSLPGQHYMASRPVDEKTNEIPVAQQLIPELDLEGRLVALDALHTQTRTARVLAQEAGADYLLTVKGNQETLQQTLKTLFTATPAAFSPSAFGEEHRPLDGEKSRAT